MLVASDEMRSSMRLSRHKGFVFAKPVIIFSQMHSASSVFSLSKWNRSVELRTWSSVFSYLNSLIVVLV
jgi:hypothetical protein